MVWMRRRGIENSTSSPACGRMLCERHLRGYGLIGYTIPDASNGTSFLQQLEHQAPKKIRVCDRASDVGRNDSDRGRVQGSC